MKSAVDDFTFTATYPELLEIKESILRSGWTNPKDVAFKKFSDWIDKEIEQVEYYNSEGVWFKCPECKHNSLRSNWVNNRRICPHPDCKFRVTRKFYRELEAWVQEFK